MISKTKQKKIALKHFIKYVNEVYDYTDFEDGDSGMMNFEIEGEWFCVHRSYLDVYSWKMVGDKDYEKCSKIECQLQEALHTIKRKVEDEIITE